MQISANRKTDKPLAAAVFRQPTLEVAMYQRADRAQFARELPSNTEV
jgi:hypothetical protein